MTRFTHLLDYLIYERDLMPPEERFKKRSLALIFIVLNMVCLFMVILQQFGHYKEEDTFYLLAICLLAQIALKFRVTENLALSGMMIGGTAYAVINICNTGNIFSYNIKWLGVILILVNFALGKGTFAFTTFCVSLLVFYYYCSDPAIDLLNIGTDTDHFWDSMAYLLMMLCFLRIIRRYERIQRNRIEEQRRRLKEQQTELLASNALLKERSKELEASNQELERFAYIASHDLKTPLNNIISFSRLLEEEISPLKDPKIDQYFGFIKDGSLKMNELINDVLEYSRLTAPVDNTSPVDLNVVIAEIQDSISHYLSKKNAKVKVNGTLPTIRANKTRLYLLFKNLIENGVKYNEQFQPEVNISYEKTDRFHQCCIQDNGIGIAKEYQERIFNMFTRLHNGTEYEGTGLGLSLSKKIVEVLGGSIRVESEPGKGASFYLTFPIESIDSGEPIPSAEMPVKAGES